MALKQYEVSYTDGSEPDVAAPTFADSIAFEAHLRAKPSLGKLQDNAIMSIGYRCYAALHRAGRVRETWSEFANRVADIELIEESEPADSDDEFAVDEAGAISGKSTRPAQ